MLDWSKHKLESRLPGEISITSDRQIHHPYGRNLSGVYTNLPMPGGEGNGNPL